MSESAIAREDPVGLGRQIKIAFREPVNFMRPDFHFAPTPRQIQVGMMAFFLGDRANRIHESQGLRKVFKFVQALDMPVGIQRPSLAQLAQQFLHLRPVPAAAPPRGTARIDYQPNS